MTATVYMCITDGSIPIKRSSLKSECFLPGFHAIKKTMRYNIIKIEITFNDSHTKFSFRKGSANL